MVGIDTRQTIKNQLDAKQSLISSSNLINPQYLKIAANQTTVDDTKNITPVEFGRLKGIQSNVQNQINLKANINNQEFTGNVVLPSTTILKDEPTVNSNNNSVPTTKWVKDITSKIEKEIGNLADATKKNTINLAKPYSVAEQTRIDNSVKAVDDKFISYEQTSSITTKLASKQDTISDESLPQKRIKGLTKDIKDLNDAIKNRPIGTTITNTGADKDTFVKSNVIYTDLLKKQDKITDESLPQIRITGLTAKLKTLTADIADRPIGTTITNTGADKDTFVKSKHIYNKLLNDYQPKITEGSKLSQNKVANLTENIRDINIKINNRQKVINDKNKLNPELVEGLDITKITNNVKKIAEQTAKISALEKKTTTEFTSTHKNNIDNAVAKTTTHSTDIAQLKSEMEKQISFNAGLMKGKKNWADTFEEIADLIGDSQPATSILKQISVINSKIKTVQDTNLPDIEKWRKVHKKDIETNETKIITNTNNITTNDTAIKNINKKLGTDTFDAGLTITGKIKSLSEFADELGTKVNKKQDNITDESLPQKRITGLTKDIKDLNDAIKDRPIGTTITNSGDDRDKFVKSNVIYTALSAKQDEIRDETDKRLSQTLVEGLTSKLSEIDDELATKQVEIENETDKRLAQTHVEGLTGRLQTIEDTIDTKQNILGKGSIQDFNVINGLTDKFNEIELKFENGFNDEDRKEFNNIKLQIKAFDTSIKAYQKQIAAVEEKQANIQKTFGTSAAIKELTSDISLIKDREEYYKKIQTFLDVEYPYHNLVVTEDIQEKLDGKTITPEDIIKEFIKLQVDVNMKDDEGQTPIHKLAAYGTTEKSKTKLGLLTANKAELNAQDDIGMTPVILATSNRNEVMMQYFYDLPDGKIIWTQKLNDGRDITDYIFGDTDIYQNIRAKFNKETQENNARLKAAQDVAKAQEEALARKEMEKTREKMRDFKKSDFTENDVRSLININLQLIDIINNKLDL